MGFGGNRGLPRQFWATIPQEWLKNEHKMHSLDLCFRPVSVTILRKLIGTSVSEPHPCVCNAEFCLSVNGRRRCAGSKRPRGSKFVTRSACRPNSHVHDKIREYNVLGASAIATSGEGGRRRRQRWWRVCVKSSGSAICVAVRLSIIGTSPLDKRSSPAEKEGGGGGRDGGVCASKCIER